MIWLIEVRENGLEITVRNTKTEVVGHLWLKSSGLIYFEFKYAMINKMINLNCILDNLVDASANDTVTLFHLHGSSQLNFMFEWLEAGKLQRIVLVIMSKSTNEVLERWNFSIETDNEIVETGVSREKSDKEIMRETQAIMRQIASSITYLPCLDEPCGSRKEEDGARFVGFEVKKLRVLEISCNYRRRQGLLRYCLGTIAITITTFFNYNSGQTHLSSTCNLLTELRIKKLIVCVKLAGFLLPCYVLVRSWYILYIKKRRQDCVALAKKRVQELQQILSEAISDMEVD